MKTAKILVKRVPRPIALIFLIIIVFGWCAFDWANYENNGEAEAENYEINYQHPLFKGSLDEDFVPPNNGIVDVQPDDLYLMDAGGQDSPTNVAIFQDRNPWGFNSTQAILTAYGIPYTIYGSSAIGRGLST